MVNNWQTDRGQLNHNWLQNGVLVALNHALGITAGTVRSQNVRQTLAEDIERWQERRHELPALLARFEDEMSPKIFFDREPLSNCTEEDRSWLLPITHDLWLQREKVKEKVDTAMSAYETATQSYSRLHSALEQLPEVPGNEDLGPFQLLLQEFKTACETLSRAISAFPQGIRCV
ncbi:MAG: hypothetical protein NT166_11240 [Candidatus Aminicenantes bacterium]|nr:hypothetical protein [Candidatus Aminicenantes bacterium]